jgi:hypothetical protein
MQGNTKKIFNPLVSSILTLVGGGGLLIMNLQEGKLLMILLSIVIFISGVGMLIKYLKERNK